MSSPIRSKSRRGQSLLLVFLMLVAIVGVLALTLDFGFVILARRQMQTGVNPAALEGLRNIDLDDDNVGDGRASAKKLVQNVFDDDLDPRQNGHNGWGGYFQFFGTRKWLSQSNLGKWHELADIVSEPKPICFSTCAATERIESDSW